MLLKYMFRSLAVPLWSAVFICVSAVVPGWQTYHASLFEKSVLTSANLNGVATPPVRPA